MTNMLYGAISKSCNKLMIGKTFWKCVVMPSILYRVNVIPLTENDIKQLQIIENAVYRRILGGTRHTPICTLRGEISSSLMKTRIMRSHLQYIRGALQGSNGLVKKVINIQIEEGRIKWAKVEEGRIKWAKVAKKYLQLSNLKMNDLEHKTKAGINKEIVKWHTSQWEEEIKDKKSLTM